MTAGEPAAPPPHAPSRTPRSRTARRELGMRGIRASKAVVVGVVAQAIAAGGTPHDPFGPVSPGPAGPICSGPSDGRRARIAADPQPIAPPRNVATPRPPKWTGRLVIGSIRSGRLRGADHVRLDRPALVVRDVRRARDGPRPGRARVA